MMSAHANKATEGNGSKRCSVVNHTSEFSTDMVFRSRQELMDWVKNTGRSLGYVIVTERSNGMFNVILKCDRGGIYKSTKISRKNTRSKKINCPFKLAGKYSKRNDFWTLRVICDKHNHDPSSRIDEHPYSRRLTNDEMHLVEDLTKKKVKPSDILLKLKEKNTNNVSSLTTIYNARHKVLKNLKEKAPSETMVCDVDVHTIDKYMRNNHADLPIEEPSKRSCFNGSCPCSYINQFPNMFGQYITQVQDVKSDENCGFRAIAVCLGFNEDAWPTIRADLMDELNTHKNEYDEIFGRECRLQLHNALNFFRSDIAATSKHWMTLPEMGILIASRYNVILHCLSVGDGTTYFPLRSTPPVWYEHVAIAIGHVNDNHYVKLTVKDGYPMPPIVPLWNLYRHECASPWVTPYFGRLNMYTRCYHSHCNFRKITKDT